MSNSNSNSLKGAIDESISLILKSNFLQDSQRVCITTLLKVITTILNKPQEEKVRKLRLSNATIKSKIVEPQGTQLLLAIGFLQVMEPPKTAGGEIEQSLFLPLGSPLDPLHMARHQLQQLAIHQLKCSPDSLPQYNPVTVSAPAGASDSSASQNNFDPYVGSRYDAKSAAMGQNVGPPSNWKSSTYQQLESLQKKQAKLESKLQKTPGGTIPREWIATCKTSQVLKGGGNEIENSQTKKEDTALLAQQLQKQQTAAQLEAKRGFTTKAMRDLERLKKQKVYSHCQLAIEFPNGTVVKGNFLPKESVASVQQAIMTEVLVVDGGGGSSSLTACAALFDLYITPPRTLLKVGETLQGLGLVPAAKVYISWKTKRRLDIQPRLFGGARTSQQGPSAPTAKALVDNGDDGEDSKPPATAGGTQKKKKTKAEKEAELLKRMMGGM